MNERLLADLDAFGRGDLAREDLAASHGGEAISLLAMHDRMFAVAAATPAIDADAGWAALSSQLDAVVVPLVPRRGVRRRTMAIAVAAALLLGGSAFAATRTGWFDDPVVPTPSAATAPSGSTSSGSGLGAPGAASADRVGARLEQEARDPSDPDDDPSGAPGDGDPDGSTGGTGGTGGDTGDDPNDHDQGTGNDGDHDDQGGGNDGQEGEQGGGQGPDDPGGGSQGRPTEPPGA